MQKGASEMLNPLFFQHPVALSLDTSVPSVCSFVALLCWSCSLGSFHFWILTSKQLNHILATFLREVNSHWTPGTRSLAHVYPHCLSGAYKLYPLRIWTIGSVKPWVFLGYSCHIYGAHCTSPLSRTPLFQLSCLYPSWTEMSQFFQSLDWPSTTVPSAQAICILQG